MDQVMKKSNNLNVRDLITTGVLSALYVVTAFVGELMFGFFPVLTFLCPLSIALICGPVFMLIIAKVPKRGPLFITGILVGLVLFVTGMYWLMCAAYVVLGIVAEFVAGSANFKSKTRNLLSYMIFVISPIFSYAMLWIDRNGYVKYLVDNGTDPAYMETMIANAHAWVLPAMIVGNLICSFISGRVGQLLLRKHFEKAGVV